ncbi:SCO4225 family membrane protein [Actinomadura monticuli]|uniref:Uncharacterized protein n=1 Tax=Actinomadura monticuli TaxID=3097367 RepID=A0ABV4QL14_9ACTN
MPPHFLSFAGRGTADRIRLVLAALYAATVLVTTAVVLVVTLVADDPGFIGVWVVFVSCPLSMLGLLATQPFGDLPEPLGTIVFFAVTTGAGLVQAWILWPSARKVTAAGGPGTGRRPE